MCAGLHSLGNILSLGSRTCFAQRVHKFTAFNFEGQKVAFSNKMQREVLQEADFEEGSEGVWRRSFKLKFGCGKYPQRFHTSFVSNAKVVVDFCTFFRSFEKTSPFDLSVSWLCRGAEKGHVVIHGTGLVALTFQRFPLVLGFHNVPCMKLQIS